MESSTPELPDQDSRIRAAVARSLDALRSAAHPTLTAVLCSSACAPVVAAAVGAGAVPVALLGALGGIGGGALTNVISGVLDRLKREHRDPPTEAEIGSALAARLDELSSVATEEAAEIRSDIASVLVETGAVRIAVETAMEAGDEDLLSRLFEELQHQAEAFEEFKLLLDDMRDATDEILERLRRFESRQHSSNRELMALLSVILDRIPAAGLHEQPSSPALNEPPYRGLWPYREEHAPLFYGRDAAVADLVERAAASLDLDGVLAVTGASGAGKSSLLQAGFLPALGGGDFPVDGSRTWPRLVMTPGREPLETLAARLASAGGPDAVTAQERLESDPDKAHLLAAQCLPRPSGDAPARLVLVIDQFEELFTLVDEPKRQAFITAIMSIASGGSSPTALVVLGLRGDFVDRLAAYPELVPVLQDSAFIVGPMSEHEMRQAITGPAAETRAVLDEGLADDLLADLGDASDGTGFNPAKLPLLSQTMLMLWERRDAERLTRREYTKLGGVANAVRASAEEVYLELDADKRRIARQLFRRMVKVARGGALAKRTVHLATIAGLGAGHQAVLEAFTTQRLIVLETETVDIAHDALLQYWSRLREWMEDDRESLVLHAQLIDDASEWEAKDRDPSFLYRGTRFATVEHERWNTWRGHPEQFPPPGDSALAFLAAARLQERRRGRTRQIVAASIAGLVTLVMVATALVLISNQRMIDQQNFQISTQLAAASAEVAATDGPLAQLLAAAAWQVEETDEAWAAMANAVHQPSVEAVGDRGSVHSLDFAVSGDGSELVHASALGGLVLRDTETWEERRLGEAVDGHVSAVAVNDDGSIVLSGNDEQITVIHAASGEVLARLAATVEWAGQMALSPDGAHLAAVYDDDAVRVWDFETFETIATLPIASRPTAVGFTASGSELVIGDEEGRVRSWNLAEQRETRSSDIIPGGVNSVKPVPGHVDELLVCGDDCGIMNHAEMTFSAIPGAIGFGAVSADGSFVATRQIGDTIGVWTLDDLGFVGTVPADPNTFDLEFGPDSNTLYSEYERTLVVWDIHRMRDVSIHDVGHYTRDLEYSVDGSRLIRTGDGPAQAWEADGTELSLANATPDLHGHDTALGPDGALAASADGEAGGSDIVLWDPESEAALAVLEGHTGYVTGLDFNSDGSKLMSATSHTISGFEGTGTPDEMSEVRIWDLESGQVTTTIALGEEHPPVAIDLSPDDRTVAVLDDAGDVTEWDAATGRLLRDLPLGNDEADEIAYSPDGTTLAAGTVNGLAVWEPGADRASVLDLGGTTGIVHRVEFSSDGSLVAQAVVPTRSGALAVVIRDLERDRVLTVIPVWTPVTAMTFSPDGRTLVVGVGDEDLQLYDLGYLDDPYSAVCEQAGRQLTTDEWRTYLPGIPFGSIHVCG